MFLFLTRDDWNHSSKHKDFGKTQVNTGMIDQTWTDLKK